jgi:hypothetical protein
MLSFEIWMAGKICKLCNINRGHELKYKLSLKKFFRPDLCRPAERFFQLDGREEASTGGRGSSGVGIS